MKKLLVIGIIAMMIAGMSVAASAAVQADFFFGLKAVPTAVQGMGANWLATASDAVNGDDGSAAGYNAAYVPAQSNTLEMDVVGPLLDPAGRWQVDYRENLTGPTDQIVWNLKAYMNTATLTTNSFNLAGYFVSNGGAITDPNFYVKVYDGQGTTGALLKTFNQATGYGSESAPSWTSGTFTLASKTDAHYFTVVAGTAPASVPEPGSMLAMLSGLVGLVGFGIRRRK